MKDNQLAKSIFKNADRPFTEILPILLGNEQIISVELKLSYTTDNILIMIRHIENSTRALLDGMQNMGLIIGSVATDNCNDLGFLFSLMCNMIEALNDLHSDLIYVLKQREIKEHYTCQLPQQ